jgi:hypothetical protein
MEVLRIILLYTTRIIIIIIVEGKNTYFVDPSTEKTSFPWIIHGKTSTVLSSPEQMLFP